MVRWGFGKRLGRGLGKGLDKECGVLLVRGAQLAGKITKLFSQLGMFID